MGQLSVDLSTKDQLEHGPKPGQRKGLSFERYFTARLAPGRTPYDESDGRPAPPPSATIRAR